MIEPSANRPSTPNAPSASNPPGIWQEPTQLQEFVCSEMLAIQRSIAQQKGGYSRVANMRTLAIFWACIITVCLTACFWRGVLGWANPLSVVLTVPVLLWWISHTWVQVRKGRAFMPFPTNLCTDSVGVTLLWRDIERESSLIPWGAIRDVSVANDTLNLLVNTNYSDASWASTVLETSALWATWHPFGRNNGKFDRHTIGLGFPLTSLTLDSDRLKLLASIESHLGLTDVDMSLRATPIQGAPSTYTQLWLDDLHSFNRSRLDELGSGCTLQDGRYEVASLIGSGGQAKIYRALDWRTDLPVVLKEIVLPLHGGVDKRARAFERVKNEALLLSKLSHPGIVTLLDHFVEDHRAYLVFEHIEGQTLRQMVEEGGPVPVEKVRTIAAQICTVLDYLHQCSPAVVHRDLSPDNLMIGKAGHVKLIDFSVAQDVSQASTRTVVGKNNYIAPEQFRGHPTTQSDLYSLGATLYFLLTGADPVAISNSRPSERLGAACALDEVVVKLTQLDPSERFASASECQFAR
jgi:tRNA A-37 threonylcarbamoyl transferase component Bud32